MTPDPERVRAVAEALLHVPQAWPRTGDPSDDAWLARAYAEVAVAALDAYDFGEQTPWGAVKAVRRARAERETP